MWVSLLRCLHSLSHQLILKFFFVQEARIQATLKWGSQGSPVDCMGGRGESTVEILLPPLLLPVSFRSLCFCVHSPGDFSGFPPDLFFGYWSGYLISRHLWIFLNFPFTVDPRVTLFGPERYRFQGSGSCWGWLHSVLRVVGSCFMALHMLCPREPGGLEKDMRSAAAAAGVLCRGFLCHWSKVVHPLPPYWISIWVPRAPSKQVLKALQLLWHCFPLFSATDMPVVYLGVLMLRHKYGRVHYIQLLCPPCDSIHFLHKISFFALLSSYCLRYSFPSFPLLPLLFVVRKNNNFLLSVLVNSEVGPINCCSGSVINWPWDIKDATELL